MHGHLCVLFTLNLPFYFLLYLPPLFSSLNNLKSVVNLHNSCNESMDSTDEFSLSTGYEPKADDFSQTSVDPYMQLLDSQPVFSNKVSSADNDDATLEDMLDQVHRAQAYHSLREDLSESLSFCPTIKKSKFLQNAKQESINTNFKQLGPKKINDFFKDNYYSTIRNYVKLIKEVSLKWKT